METKSESKTNEARQQTSCDCHKKLEQFGIPLFISDENDFYGENQKAIAYEGAFRLPGLLFINDEITEYLKVEDNDLSVLFEQMAEVFPTLWDYEENVLSFWILDVLIEGLWTAQDAKMCFEHQKATLLWIAYFFNYIQKENPSRKQLFQHLKAVLLSNGDEDLFDVGGGENLTPVSEPEKLSSPIAEIYWRLPLPPTIYENERRSTKLERNLEEEGSTEEFDSGEALERLPTLPKTSSEHDTDRNISDMKIILEILYRIFARVYAYQHIQTVLNMMPSLERINLPFTLKTPKTLAKPEMFAHSKMHVGKKSSFSEKSSEDIEAEKQLFKNTYILPLEAAEEAKEYLKQPSSDRSVLWRNREDKTKK